MLSSYSLHLITILSTDCSYFMTSLPVSWHTVMPCSIGISATWLCTLDAIWIYRGLLVIWILVESTSSTANSGSGYLASWCSTCLFALLDHPWENTFPSCLTGVDSRGWVHFLIPWPIPHPGTGIPAAWPESLISYPGPQYSSPGPAGSPGALLTGSWNLFAHLPAHLGIGIRWLSLPLPPVVRALLPLHPSLSKWIVLDFYFHTGATAPSTGCSSGSAAVGSALSACCSAFLLLHLLRVLSSDEQCLINRSQSPACHITLCLSGTATAFLLLHIFAL